MGIAETLFPAFRTKAFIPSMGDDHVIRANPEDWLSTVLPPGQAPQARLTADGYD
jgi:hypothetical protein